MIVPAFTPVLDVPAARRQMLPGSVGNQYGQLLSQGQVLNDEVTT